MERSAVGAVNPARAVQRRPRDAMIRASGLALLTAIAAAAFGRGAFFSTVQWFVVVLIAVAFTLALGARAFSVADLASGYFLAGVLLALWGLLRAAVAGTPGSGLAWVLFGAGTAAVVSVSRRLDAASRAMLLSGVLAVGVAVAVTGWLGVALHQRPWGLPSQGLWRAASTLTYANATAALLVPLALVALARLAGRAGHSCPGGHLPADRRGRHAQPRGGGGVRGRAARSVLGTGSTRYRQGRRRADGRRRGSAARPRPVLGGHRTRQTPGGGHRGRGRLALSVLIQRVPLRALILPAAGAALAAALLMIYRAPEVHGAVHALTHARFTLASPDRSGEAAAAMHMIGRHPVAGVGPGHGDPALDRPGGRPARQPV